jgi:hypothetical protein
MATDKLYDNTKAGVTAGVIRLGDANVATVATGLASADGSRNNTLDANGVFGKAGAGTQTVTTLTDAATINWDWSTAPNAQVTLGGNRTLNIQNAFPGMRAMLKVIQDGTGSRTLTTPGWLKPALSTAGGSVDEFDVKQVDATPTYFGTMAKTCV